MPGASSILACRAGLSSVTHRARRAHTLLSRVARTSLSCAVVATRTSNPIDVVEAAYELARDDRDWLTNLVAQLRSVVDCGLGVMAYMVTPQRSVPAPMDLEVQGMSVTDAMQFVAIAAAGIQAGSIGPMHQGDESLDTLLGTAARLGKSDSVGSSPMALAFAAKGVRDAVGFRAVQPAGPGLAILAPSPREVRLARRAKRLWARVAAHITAAQRLRMAATAGADIEAVCTPDGQIADASGEGSSRDARAAVREAVLRRERSRGKARHDDPIEATEAWTALVSGRWSLVDRFEQGGRRYIVARRNEHALTDPRALSPRERAVTHLVARGKSNKLVAYELGLTESTVATHLTTAMRKLGARTRCDLIQMLSGLVPS